MISNDIFRIRVIFFCEYYECTFKTGANEVLCRVYRAVIRALAHGLDVVERVMQGERKHNSLPLVYAQELVRDGAPCS